MEPTVEGYTKAFEKAGFDLTVEETSKAQHPFTAKARSRTFTVLPGLTGSGANAEDAAGDCWRRYDQANHAGNKPTS